MADTKISELTEKTTTVDLTADVFAVVSGGNTEKVSADKIPFTKIMSSSTSIYIDPAGNDTTGTGEVGNPFATPHKAYEYLQDFFLGAGVIATIQCTADTFTIASTIIPYHPQGSQVILKGATMLGTVVDGDFVASAVTTTTNLETRYATVFRGNFAGSMIEDGSFGSDLLFKHEDILFDGDSTCVEGVSIAIGSNIYPSGSVSFINFTGLGIILNKYGSLYDSGDYLSSTHNSFGLLAFHDSFVFLNVGTIAYNANTGVNIGYDSSVRLDGAFIVRDNTGDGITSTQNGTARINSSASSTANTGEDYLASDEGFINILTGALSSGDTVKAENRSSIHSAATAGVTFSPAHSVNGNTDSLIYA